MLPRNFRLTNTRDFSRLYESGRQVTSPLFRLFLAPHKQGGQNQNVSRFGFVVSTKHVGKIVERNWVKRILRAEIQKNLKNIIPGFDILVQVRKPLTKPLLRKVATQLEQLLKQAHLWHQEF